MFLQPKQDNFFTHSYLTEHSEQKKQQTVEKQQNVSSYEQTEIFQASYLSCKMEELVTHLQGIDYIRSILGGKESTEFLETLHRIPRRGTVIRFD
ncbi:hypothetical protein TNCT_468311 [Trichonephila clavata]|uniref:Uncharacterized protein n=1 Tax=Trichonephila clavata TaxID=2740835 RepID=A0A8X6KAV3_TRICU|nr:hypothetical protein TNCT_468311 [Trichonephila clavata]